MLSLEAYWNLPLAHRRMRIGLFGGSFNPPHEGHALVAKTALKRLHLDKIWWMVTPGNPLKKHIALLPLAERVAQSAGLIENPKICVTAFEASLGSCFFENTLSYLVRRYSGVHFVLVLGADVLKTFHRWRRWRFIVDNIPLVIVDRPQERFKMHSSPFFYCYRKYEIPQTHAQLLPLCHAPAWTYLTGPLCEQSSTAIRAKERYRRGSATF